MDDCYFNEDTKLRIEEMSKRNLENHDFIKNSLYWHLEKPGYNIESIIEELWQRFRRYADKDLKHNMLLDKQCFLERFWEMYCGIGLLNNGLEIDTLNNHGPDFYVGEWWNKKYYIECNAPGLGDEKKADTLSKLKFGVFSLPSNQFQLRLTFGLKEKLEKYRKYIQEGVVNDSDCLIIAISNIKLSQYGSLMDYPVPVIDKVLFGIHDPVINLETGNMHLSKRCSISKSNNSKVPVSLFSDEKYRIISGVIYSNIDILNLSYPENPEKTFIFRENPNANNKLSGEFLQYMQV